MAEKSKTTKETLREIHKSSIVLTVLVVALVILFFGLSFYANIQPEPSPPTLEEKFQQTIDGEETNLNFLYNGFAFIYDDPLWIVKVGARTRDGIQEFNIPFYFNAQQVENITLQQEAVSALEGKTILYLTQDPDAPAQASIGAIEVGRILGTRYGIFDFETKATLTYNATPGEPEIDCSDVGRVTGVIYFVVGNQTGVFERDGCIVVEGETPTDVIRSADRFAYGLLGILRPAQVVPDATRTISVDDVTFSVNGLVLQQAITGPSGGIIQVQDTAEGVFHVVQFDVTNNGDEIFEFSPGIIKAKLDDTQLFLDYETQRFLPQRMFLDNAVQPGQTASYQVAYDITEVGTRLEFIVDVVGQPEQSVVLPIIG